MGWHGLVVVSYKLIDALQSDFAGCFKNTRRTYIYSTELPACSNIWDWVHNETSWLVDAVLSSHIDSGSFGATSLVDGGKSKKNTSDESLLGRLLGHICNIHVQTFVLCVSVNSSQGHLTIMLPRVGDQATDSGRTQQVQMMDQVSLNWLILLMDRAAEKHFPFALTNCRIYQKHTRH